MIIKHGIYDIGNCRIYYVSTASPGERWQCLNRDTGRWCIAEFLSDIEEAARSWANVPNDIPMKSVPLPVFAGTSVINCFKGRFLVGIRGNECGHGRGYLSFPGGKLDYGTDTDTAAAGAREHFDEVGRKCIIDIGANRSVSLVPSDHPELFTTNCFMKEDSVHYVTFYMKATPDWDASVDEVIPGMEPTKCAEWRWWSIAQIMDYLIGNPDWRVSCTLESSDVIDFFEVAKLIPEPMIQWMPVPHLLSHMYPLEMDTLLDL